MSDKSGIDAPNYTQTPNILFDELMADMKEGELRVALAIIRKTFGWHKDREVISLSQLQKLTGMSRQGVLNGIDDLVKRGLVKRQKSGQGYSYEMVVNEVDLSTKLTSTSQVSRPATSQPSRPEVVNLVDTQKKEEKENNKKKEKRAADAADETSHRAEVIKLYDDNVRSVGRHPFDAQQLHDLMDENEISQVKEAVIWGIKRGIHSIGPIIGCVAKMNGEKTPGEVRKVAAAKDEADASVEAFKAHAEKIQVAKSGGDTVFEAFKEQMAAETSPILVKSHFDTGVTLAIDGDTATFTVPYVGTRYWLEHQAKKAVLRALRAATEQDIQAVEFVEPDDGAVSEIPKRLRDKEVADAA